MSPASARRDPTVSGRHGKHWAGEGLAVNAPDLDPALLIDTEDGSPLYGLCGHCGITVTSADPNHRVSAILRRGADGLPGRGVECVLRGDIHPSQGGLLR